MSKQKSGQTWKHEDLGTLKWDGFEWTTALSLPAFEAFKYNPNGKAGGRSRIDFRFESEEELPPSKDEVKIALLTVKNQEALARKLTKALYDDFRGKGPDSGMWWHGDIETINEQISDAAHGKQPKSLERLQDLEFWLSSPSVWIRHRADYYDHPCGVICFESPIDSEHGIGVLTDGKRVLGTGYQMSVSPFDA